MPRSRLGLPNEERIPSSALEALQKRSRARTLSSNSSSFSTSRVFLFQEGNDREKEKELFKKNLSMRMSKCEDCEEITSLLISMRNYNLLADFWTRTSPKYTNLVRTRHTAHWNLARNPRSQRAGGLTVGVKNGYDEVNVQIPEEEKRRNLLRQTLFRNRFFFTRSFAEETRVIGQRARKGSLRNDQTRAPLGRYVATEFEPMLGRYVATEHPFRSVAT
ncbi:hypothetical protein F2Q69_00053612 [Brassica cretica]|uniref:Uncharacterized protein n=1 Tax=Brassica cretica TaxID=69181 RepID=A0A8S9N568_BRACR|nr:hypothetical protein F2Q69_00053612 [Brassica cretica]